MGGGVVEGPRAGRAVVEEGRGPKGGRPGVEDGREGVSTIEACTRLSACRIKSSFTQSAASPVRTGGRGSPKWAR